MARWHLHGTRSPNGLLAYAAALLICACGDNRARPDAGLPGDAPPDAGVDIDAFVPDADPNANLVLTGLCLDPACTQISPDAHAYAPAYELWSDGATKRRWMHLPPGTQIDTTDMNHWVFPVGTKFWKEFTRDGIRVETRYITKEKADDDAPGAWFYISYAWNAAQDDATPTFMGVDNTNGTTHDIPSRDKCRECHEANRPGRVLGFQAIQLDFDAPAEHLDLDDLIAQDLLSAPPAGAAPRFPLPGTPTDKAAYTYLHANCGTCHNPSSDVHDITRLDLRLDTTKLSSTAVVPAVATTLNVAGMTVVENGSVFDTIVIPGDPDNSIVVVRMSTLSAANHMPKLGSEVIDPTGLALVRAWIASLPP
ncbi:MAG: hypothetical protein KF773_15425 [Deltaproteobacteria bacterium]|nr:hypothetical protein [Deltaproteobacteria bacterium]